MLEIVAAREKRLRHVSHSFRQSQHFAGTRHAALREENLAVAADQVDGALQIGNRCGARETLAPRQPLISPEPALRRDSACRVARRESCRRGRSGRRCASRTARWHGKPPPPLAPGPPAEGTET